MNDVDRLRAQQLLERCEADRCRVYFPHFFQRSGVGIDHGRDRGITQPANCLRVLPSHLSGTNNSNAQRLTLRDQLRLTIHRDMISN